MPIISDSRTTLEAKHKCCEKSTHTGQYTRKKEYDFEITRSITRSDIMGRKNAI